MSAGVLVCLAGVSGAGKDTAGEYLVRRHGFRRVAMADPLKETMMGLFGLTREQLWGDARNVPDPRLGRAPRELYQRFGAACREIDPEVWIRAFRHRVETIVRDGGGRVVCTDLRTLAELRAASDLGGAVWLLERTGAGAPGAMALDATETELAKAPRETFDRAIRNDGSLTDLHRQIDDALRTLVPKP